MLACFLTNLFINHGYCFFKAKTNSLTLLNSNYPRLKHVGKNLDVYKQIAGENSLVLYLKTFVMKKTSPSAMRHLIYIKKWDSKMILEDSGYNKRLTTH